MRFSRSKAYIAATAVTIYALSTCTPLRANDGCRPLSQRCQGDVLQLCSPSQNWRDETDCSQVEGDADRYYCCMDLGRRLTCLPREQCSAFSTDLPEDTP